MIHTVLVVCGLFVGVTLLLWAVARWQRPRRVARLLARRDNPSFDQYCVAMRDVDHDIAVWLWDVLQVYCRPELTPHPEDDITMDLAIDPDEPEDWFRDFCEREGLNWRAFPAWPTELVATVGNFARWLTLGRRQLVSG